jgi:hypothetical protein
MVIEDRAGGSRRKQGNSAAIRDYSRPVVESGGMKSPRRKIRPQTGDRRAPHSAEHRGGRESGRIGANTLLRWLKVLEFQTAYREAGRATFGQSIARLQQGTSAAATTLIKLLVDPATPASVRSRAADSIFNQAAKAIEIEDIEARVSALEASFGVDQRGRGR